MSVEVTTLDESSRPTQSKALPILGVWALADPPGTLAPAATFSSFNTPTFGLTRLDSNLLSATRFRIGITDDRGDGRPDFRYHARMLYGDTVLPSQASAESILRWSSRVWDFVPVSRPVLVVSMPRCSQYRRAS